MEEAQNSTAVRLSKDNKMSDAETLRFYETSSHISIPHTAYLLRSVAGSCPWKPMSAQCEPYRAIPDVRPVKAQNNERSRVRCMGSLSLNGVLARARKRVCFVGRYARVTKTTRKRRAILENTS